MGRPLVLPPGTQSVMAGKKGCSGGYRPGAGRPAGGTAIKKTGNSKGSKKKKVIDPEPSKASVNFLGAFVKKAAAAAELAAVQNVRSSSLEA